MAHQKHTKMTRSSVGEFSRQEWAILGTPCGKIKELAFALIQHLGEKYRLAYVDADHQSADQEAEQGKDRSSALAHGAALEFTDKITFSRFDTPLPINEHQQKAYFQRMDAVLVNGNHFPAQRQIAVIDPKKPLLKKLPKLTQVELILLSDPEMEVPDFLREHLAGREVPIFSIHQTSEIAAWLDQQWQASLPLIKGLVLAGGRSTRMKQDKALLDYHGQPQRDHAYQLLEGLLGKEQVFLSCREDQLADLPDQFQGLPDSFLGLGPYGGILSAFREDPNAAWLVIACDLPLLSEKSLRQLLAVRNPSAMATAFQSPDNEFPEPLIAIWEPRAYPILLDFLSRGYSCPRKVLINSDTHLVQAAETAELTNVNVPEEYEAIKEALGSRGRGVGSEG